MTPAQRVAKWRRDNPEKARTTRRNNYYANHEREKASRRRSGLKRLYGITIDQWQAIFVSQGCRCAACGTGEPATRGKWHTDHCHRINVVRGILCSGCNQALGNTHESVHTLRSLIRYLEKHDVPA